MAATPAFVDVNVRPAVDPALTPPTLPTVSVPDPEFNVRPLTASAAPIAPVILIAPFVEFTVKELEPLVVASTVPVIVTFDAVVASVAFAARTTGPV